MTSRSQSLYKYLVTCFVTVYVLRHYIATVCLHGRIFTILPKPIIIHFSFIISFFLFAFLIPSSSLYLFILFTWLHWVGNAVFVSVLIESKMLDRIVRAEKSKLHTHPYLYKRSMAYGTTCTASGPCTRLKSHGSWSYLTLRIQVLNASIFPCVSSINK